MIKYVIKSRILVDCWTRDRKLGTVPVEIHILHTLRKTPHENLGDMCKCQTKNRVKEIKLISL